MKINFLLLGIFLTLVTSCTKGAQEALMPPCTGAPYDMYIVLPEEYKPVYGEDALGNKLKIN